MAKDSRIVGKHTLESLTVGMYADNRIIFREYIQNATDAIDKAVQLGILDRNEGQIDITIDLERREIRIRDNGTGISAEKVFHSLGDIGRSDKTHAESRGFRGIGRLGGLGYCTEIEFVTSYQGEACKTITLWDARELRRLLDPNNRQYESVMEVVAAVTIQDEQPEQENAHYFEVVLTGVTIGHDNLLDIDDVRDYLSQVTPVPFNYQRGIELQKITQHLHELGIKSEEFKIYLHDTSGNTEQIFKPYRRQVHTSNKQHDFLKDIRFFEERKGNGDLFFIGWYGVTNLSGMIKEDCVNGLRVRKRNILIGDNRSIDEFFGQNKTYQNFNRWFIGEIYVFDDGLIPNARRDDFEKNETYFAFKRGVEKTTRKLAKLPHKYSASRSNDKKLREIPSEIDKIKDEISSKGITDTRKGQLVGQVNALKKKAQHIKPNAYAKTEPRKSPQTNDDTGSKLQPPNPKVEEAQQAKTDILRQLNTLEDTIISSKNYAAARLPSTLPKTCRKQIGIIFDVIDCVVEEGLAQELREEIIKALQPKRKRKGKQ